MSDTSTTSPTVNTRISARGGLDVLSRDEVARLRATSIGGCDVAINHDSQSQSLRARRAAIR